jgi:phosphatidylglycerophosphatase C
VTEATRTVAAFDFDGTLTRRDSLVPFLARVAGWPRTLAALARHSPSIARVVIGKADRDATKERLLVHILAGRSLTEVATVGRAYGAELVARRLRPNVRERLAWHQREGHEVLIVSATLDVYLDEVARRLDVAHLLCTVLEVDDTGRCTGRLAGGNCRGPEKAERLRAYLGDATVTVWAYGDSAGDAEMLAIADHPVRITSSSHPVG